MNYLAETSTTLLSQSTRWGNSLVRKFSRGKELSKKLPNKLDIPLAGSKAARTVHNLAEVT